jgi:hypothetical protein
MLILCYPMCCASPLGGNINFKSPKDQTDSSVDIYLRNINYLHQVMLEMLYVIND